MNAATNKGPATSRLFVTDRATKEEVLVDTGSYLCVYPRTHIKGRIQMTEYQLCAANNIVINIYGDRTINLNMGLRRAFPWSVIIADISRSMIGTDFLSQYRLLVDLGNKRLLLQTTSLSARGRLTDDATPPRRTISDNCAYNQMFAELPSITRPTAATTGPPTYAKQRSHSPEMYKFVQAEFEDLMSRGLIRPSRSQWASALRMV
ncbi:uncharacterized protein LOC143429857 [Xylocopa sonorina]|uniref:uncharacterized protein LOC143429857 n=1 Tax=Xylocopa sonorina TaxID=1818115 RepID=UPI00403AA8A1